MANDKKRTRVKIFVGLNNDFEALEKKMNDWLASTEAEEEVKAIIPASVGNVVLLIVIYKA